VHGARFRPRRPVAIGAAVAVAVFVLVRVWQLSNKSTPDKLDEGNYRVASVTDGDTLRLANGAIIRFIGVDAPETRFSPRSGGEDQPFALDAKLFVEHKTANGQVRLQFDKQRIDQYGRFLAYIWYVDPQGGDELLLNEELIRAGMARARLKYQFSEQMKRRFRSAEQEARAAKRGIWSLEKNRSDQTLMLNRRPLPVHRIRVFISSLQPNRPSFHLALRLLESAAYRQG
jgi:micrococcal nuclease